MNLGPLIEKAVFYIKKSQLKINHFSTRKVNNFRIKKTFMKTKYLKKTNYNIPLKFIYHIYYINFEYYVSQISILLVQWIPEGHIPMLKFIYLEIAFDLLLFRNLLNKIEKIPYF